MLGFVRGRKKKIEGFIASAGLIEWWFGQFDEQERHKIDQIYRPMGSTPDVESILTTGPIREGSVDAASTLSNVASWFKKAEDRTIAYRFLDKAEERLPQSADILTAHFLHQIECEVFYRWRDLDDFALERAIDACHKQIALAPKAADEFKDEGEKQVVNIDFLADSEAEIQRKVRLIEKGEATTDVGVFDTLPSHYGFKQLAIILQKRGDFNQALSLCEQAKAQGWKGDWDKRIARLKKQLAKQ
jgi:tetratricopeptide (TPR) repeat protein